MKRLSDLFPRIFDCHLGPDVTKRIYCFKNNDEIPTKAARIQSLGTMLPMFDADIWLHELEVSPVPGKWDFSFLLRSKARFNSVLQYRWVAGKTRWIDLQHGQAGAN
jgi:hypothetical protein